MRHILCAKSLSLAIMVAAAGVMETQAQNFVPGTGTRIDEVGDDFENTEWSYNPNLPKVYNNKETTVQTNAPGGVAENGRWYEGSKRGQPDSVLRVETPPNGIPGSTGSLAIRSLLTGSTRPTFQQQQDDFIANVQGRIGKIPVSRAPSVVTRVWFPPFEQWEQRNDCHYAFRVAIETHNQSFKQVGFKKFTDENANQSWPGFFINMQIKDPKLPLNDPNRYRAYMWMKATSSGKRIRGPEITQGGWWTMGISLSPDGQVHYYAKPGVEDLTIDDHISSSYPFGKKSVNLRNFFFNVCNGDNGKTWSGVLIIDDPAVYVAR